MKSLTTIIQILSIIVTGMFSGAMIMLYTAVLSFWKQTKPSGFLIWYSNYSSGIIDSTGPLLMLSICLPLLSFVLVRKFSRINIYWLLSFLLCVLIMIITLIYFVDVNTSFGEKSIEIGNIKSTLNTWGNLHLIRILLALFSSFLGGIGLVKYLSYN
ncbi:DUF1772 domain-containing protein [uncultured Tenacibaculum sp.]|uniref:DUF1772 domain-containing protein n=1 Tax=uncultured Tenacibaculum sp. TaxID=174713 RepID=UPI002623EC7C|nr:DUF1772 domain-containing protein [uncultured Tenacibaculum sp.]